MAEKPNPCSGERFHAILVDNGVMRLGEFEQMAQTLQQLNIDSTTVDRPGAYLSRLKGVAEPETKKYIIWRSTADLVEEGAEIIGQRLQGLPDAGKVEFLVTGTSYPTAVESLGFMLVPAATGTSTYILHPMQLPRTATKTDGDELLFTMNTAHRNENRLTEHLVDGVSRLESRHPGIKWLT